MMAKALVVTTSRWLPTARLALALANAGFEVHAICPSRHPLAVVKGIQGLHTYHGLKPLRSIRNAIASVEPQILIPGDDLSVRHLVDLCERASLNQAGRNIFDLVEQSLGPLPSLRTVRQRAAFMQLAEEEGIRAPKTEALRTENDLRRWQTEIGFPAVIKADGSSGGEGVEVVKSLAAAESALRRLQASPLLARAAKRALMDRDNTLIWPSLLCRRSLVNIQAFISGHEATSLVACWKGKVLAGLHFDVVQKSSPAGPATVLRVVDHPDMVSAAEKIVKRLNLSGLHGFDYMVEHHTGHAYLIEVNPRATQVGHLAMGAGRDLPSALLSAVSGIHVPAVNCVTSQRTVALFPGEWQRDTNSPFLNSAYHDVPWKETDLLFFWIGKLASRKLKSRQGDCSHAFPIAKQGLLATSKVDKSGQFVNPLMSCRKVEDEIV